MGAGSTHASAGQVGWRIITRLPRLVFLKQTYAAIVTTVRCDQRPQHLGGYREPSGDSLMFYGYDYE